MTVEMHEYFGKWKTFDEGAFDGFSGDELVVLLTKGEFVPYHFYIFVDVLHFSFRTHLNLFICQSFDSAAKKAKFFFHPDKLPKDLTEIKPSYSLFCGTNYVIKNLSLLLARG